MPVFDPEPKNQREEPPTQRWPIKEITPLTRDFDFPSIELLTALNERRSSRQLGSVNTRKLSSLLWFSCRTLSCNENRSWEGRYPYPTAGGVGAIRLIVLEAGRDTAWLYEPKTHSASTIVCDSNVVQRIHHDAQAFFNAPEATLLLFGFDRRCIGHFYDHAESLMLREAGGISLVLNQVAYSLGMGFCELGTTGDSWLSQLLKTDCFCGAGAAFIGSNL